jgi:hypothetical protein
MAKWRRGHAGGHVGPLALAWAQYSEEIEMADDDLKSAYRCQVINDRMQTKHEPKARTECATIDDAVNRLQRGEAVVVANTDMGQLRSRLASFGIG